MKSEKKKMLSLLQQLDSQPVSPKAVVSHAKVSPNWKSNPNYKPLSNSTDGYLAIDCEMVSTESDQNSLARVSLVNMDGDVLLDLYVKPSSKVTNYRTFVTGIRARHLKSGLSFPEVKKRVEKCISGKVLVGHAIHHDLNALKLELPKERVRDTQSLYAEQHGVAQISLQKLCFQTLGRVIQTGSHSSIEDAWAAMEVFKTLFLNCRRAKPPQKKPKLEDY
jgi:RNA exonuclease 4